MGGWSGWRDAAVSGLGTEGGLTGFDFLLIEFGTRSSFGLHKPLA